MKLLLVLCVALLAVAAPSVARADGMDEVICGPGCWGSIEDGWVDPGTPGLAGGVRGGDGGTCDLGLALDGCTPDNIYPSPCATAWCDGDEGTGEPSLACGLYCIRFPDPEVPYEYVGDGDPWADPAPQDEYVAPVCDWDFAPADNPGGC